MKTITLAQSQPATIENPWGSWQNQQQFSFQAFSGYVTVLLVIGSVILVFKWFVTK